MELFSGNCFDCSSPTIASHDLNIMFITLGAVGGILFIGGIVFITIIVWRSKKRKKRKREKSKRKQTSLTTDEKV